MEEMDTCINERQMESQWEDGEDDVLVKKQKIGTNNMHEEDFRYDIKTILCTCYGRR